MKILFDYFLKEKIWTAIVLFFMFGGIILTVAQFLTYSNFMSGIMIIPNQKKVPALTNEFPSKASIQEMSFYEKIKKTAVIFKEQGRDAALNFVIEQRSQFFIILFGMSLIIIVLSQQFFMYMKDLSLQFLSLRIANNLRVKYFRKLLHLPSNFYKENISGDLVNKGLTDIDKVALHFPHFLENIIFAPIITLLGVIILFSYNSTFTILIAFSGFLTVIAINFLSKILKKVISKVRENLSDISSHIQSIIYGIDIVKIFNRENYEYKRFHRIVRAFQKMSFKSLSLTYLNRPINETFGALALLSILLYASALIWQGLFKISDLIQFIILMLMIAPYAQRIGMAFIYKQEISVSMERILSISELKEEDIFINKEKIFDFKDQISIRNLSYRYPATEILALNKINLEISRGEMTAFVGTSGSGKTTLSHIISGFLSSTEGDIYFDGVNIKQYSLNNIRNNISIVTQESILFPGTIKENILYGNLEATEEEMIAAAEKVDIIDYIKSTENGFETFIGERGLKLSGGQRQRLCIARAIISQPKLLILDEATSSLDNQSELSIKKAIDNLMHQLTIIVIAHRLSTVQSADKIFVLKKGQIIEQGNHKSLLQRNGFYNHLYNLQFS